MPSITVTQRPEIVAAAQSPIVFSVRETNNSYTSSGYQYTAKIWAWKGVANASGSYLYQVNKYPNTVGSGIFDIGKLINSKMTDLLLDVPSSIWQYKVEFGDQWYSASLGGSILMTGSVTASVTGSGTSSFFAFDGYQTFPNAINSATGAAWPFMTDAVGFTQSVVSSNGGIMSLWCDTGKRLSYTASYENGTTSSIGVSINPTAGSTGIVKWFVSSPGHLGFPLSTSSLKSYSISTGGKSLHYEVVCEPYYIPYRVGFKNRYGQWDWISFNKKSTATFNTDQRVYQPQIGSWNSNTLSYNTRQGRSQRYIVDTTEEIILNTGFISEGYNNIIKQLMVTDEIYYLDNTSTPYRYFPLSIKTNSVEFKTVRNNKLVQYEFVFEIGSSYKLIL
jgi:hypothetical protein